jgi:hypothetical protein
VSLKKTDNPSSFDENRNLREMALSSK